MKKVSSSTKTRAQFTAPEASNSNADSRVPNEDPVAPPRRSSDLIRRGAAAKVKAFRQMKYGRVDFSDNVLFLFILMRLS